MRRAAPDLEALLADWGRRPVLAHAGAVLLLSLLAALRWWRLLSFPGPLSDEIIYLGAFRNVAAGLSPFAQSGYLYPPFTAFLGGWLLERFGEQGVLWFFRVANLAGVSTAVWCALAFVPWRWRWRLLTGGLVLALSPMVRFGVRVSNTSLLIAGLLIAGLLLWRRSALLAGLLLGVSVALKPMAPVAIAVLFAHRPVGGGQRHRLAAGMAVAIAALLLLALPYFGDMLALDLTERVARTASLHRLPSLVGWELSPVWITALIAMAAVVLARRRVMAPALFLAFALTATLASTPLVWSHALIATMPLQAMALWVAWRRYGRFRQEDDPLSPPGVENRGKPAAAVPSPSRVKWSRYELTLVALAVIGIQFAEGVTGIEDRAAVLQFVGLVPTALGPIALAAYVWAATPRSPLDQDSAGRLASKRGTPD